MAKSNQSVGSRSLFGASKLVFVNPRTKMIVKKRAINDSAILDNAGVIEIGLISDSMHRAGVTWNRAYSRNPPLKRNSTTSNR